MYSLILSWRIYVLFIDSKKLGAKKTKRISLFLGTFLVNKQSTRCSNVSLNGMSTYNLTIKINFLVASFFCLIVVHLLFTEKDEMYRQHMKFLALYFWKCIASYFYEWSSLFYQNVCRWKFNKFFFFAYALKWS